MSNNGDFIPRRKADATNYGALVHGVISAPDYDPATLGLSDDDVAELGDALSANQAVLSEINVLKAAMQAKTTELSGPNGTHRRMVASLRKIGNKARASSADGGQLASIGVKRKTTNPSRRGITSDAPGFLVGEMFPNVMRVAFRVTGSNSTRARAENAIGVQVAVVDGANPPAAGEADRVPIKMLSRSPAQMDTSGWPVQVRLYARWISQRGETSGWSSPQSVRRP
jgi:hypothetical protein